MDKIRSTSNNENLSVFVPNGSLFLRESGILHESSGSGGGDRAAVLEPIEALSDGRSVYVLDTPKAIRGVLELLVNLAAVDG
jgi:hypothetical protein